MTTICKYCNEAENKQEKPGLICENCFSFIHLSCLRRLGTPGDFNCDVFFEFTCEDCSPDKKERFRRNKFPWVQVILLTVHHLSLKAYGISNHGYFHYKTHICSFIDRYWQSLFGTQLKQKKNWIGTIAGALSVYNNLFFKSGSTVLGESGWWKLKHYFSPAVAMHILQEMARDKPKGRPRNQMALDRSLFYSKVTEMGYRELLNTEPDTVPGLEPVPSKKRRVDSDELSGVSSASYLDQIDSYHSTEGVDESPFESALSTVSGRGRYSETDPLLAGVELGHSSQMLPSDSSSIHSYQQSTLFYDSDTPSGSPYPAHPPSDSDEKPRPGKKPDGKKKTVSEDRAPIRRETLFSEQLNSVDLPWLPAAPVERTSGSSDLVEVSQYEEIQLLKQVENLIPKVKHPSRKAFLCGFKASLALRRLKRHKHLPLFDIDKTVKLLGGYVTEDSKSNLNTERVLDRFQRSYLIDNLCGTIASTNYGTLLLSDIEPAPFRSAYSGAVLKPFIRRDAESKPQWVRLMEELHMKAKSSSPVGYRVRCIEYSYVRPGHIAALNSLTAQHFWPGIDLSETLQYPEFSCVVTYGRVVVGCAVLVPGVRRHEAYISFLVVRPHWRRAGIAATMLYHLLQTCSGQDVTLHCSPTNPAIFLYQKFGFKVEEMVQDFYEKYYDIDYKGCRHALFLRLVR